jgi:hypothetical protein
MKMLKVGAGFATEYAWARHWRDRLRDEGAKLRHRIGRGVMS